MIYHYLNKDNPVCLPKKFNECLKTRNYLSEYSTEEDKMEVLNNLGILNLIENLIKEHIVSTFGDSEDLTINQKILSEFISNNETFTKEEILNLITSLKKLDIISVEELPQPPSEETRGKLFFVHKTPGESIIKVEETVVVEKTPSSGSTNETTEIPTEQPINTEPNQEENNQQETQQGESQEQSQEQNQEENQETNEGESQGENTSENNNEGENIEENNSEKNPAEESSSDGDNTQITTKTTTTTTKVTAENTHDVYVTVVKTIYPQIKDEWKNVINLGDIHESRYEKIIQDLGVGTYIFNVLGTIKGIAYIYRVTPLSMTYDKPSIPEKVIVDQMAMNRDGKYYQVCEDGRWKEYIPAASYEWLYIGTTHINFNDYYTKEEVDSLFAKKVELIEVANAQEELPIDPNKFYKLTNPVGYKLSVILNAPTETGIVNEYMLEFKVADGFEWECAGIRWIDGEAPDWEVGSTYQVSILNGLAVAAGWEATV